jgi:hypothetical protein
MIAKHVARTNVRQGRRQDQKIESLEQRWMLTSVIVNTLNDQVYPPSTNLISLRSAFIAANASTTPTTITFDPTIFADPETLVLTSSLQLTGGELTTITGPAAELTISGGGGNFDLIDSGYGVPVDYSSFTVADGGDGLGLGGPSTVEDLIVTGNSDVGLGCGGTATLQNVSVTNNGFDGIENTGTLTLNDVTASNNGRDGINNTLNGIFSEGHLTATNVAAQNNGGRGIDISAMTEAVITDSVLSQNLGGGVSDGGTATLENDTISNNTAASGGGVFSTATTDGAPGDDSGGLTLINDTIVSNTATNVDGGGIWNNGVIEIKDTTISGNSAVGSGGGLYNSSPLTLSISNTIIAQNSIGAAGGGTGPDCSGDVTSDGYNLIGETDGGGPWLATDLTGTGAQPLSPGLGTLADNGGATQTLLPLAGSPVINHGSNGLVPSGVTADQRGLTRIYDGTVDIGSVEAQAAAGANIVVSAPPSQEAAVGVSQSFTLGSFTGTDTTGLYTIKVDWGDRTASFSTTAIDPGTIDPESHSYAAGGTDTVTVTVTDSTGFISGSAAFTVTVASLTLTPAAAQTAIIDTVQPFTLGSFAETGGASPNSVDVNWNDGSGDTVFTQAAAGTISPASHIYVAAGTTEVTETVTDASGRVSATGMFAVTVTTGSAASSVAIQASAGSVTFGTAVTLTASVQPQAATGIVTFLVGGVAVGTAAIGTGGVASLSTTALGPGTSSIMASYGGSPILAPSRSSAITVLVAAPPAATTISIQSSSGAINSSQSVTLTASVSPASSGGTAVSGTVTFYLGELVLGTATIGPDGVATLVTTTSLAIGTDAITAIFGGEASFDGSTSPAATITVVPTTSRTILASSSPSMTLAQAGTLSATIEPQVITANSLSTIGAAGTVTFTDGGTVIGTAPVGADGVATLNVANELLPGINAVVAIYNGDAAFEPSTSAGEFVEVTAHALVPVIRKVTVPASVIGGAPARGMISAQLTNELSNVEDGTETGYVAVHVYASPTTTLAVNSAALVGDVLRKINLKEGQSVRITVPLQSVPASLASGEYHLLVQTTDAMGNIEVVDTGSMITVVAPSIELSASFVSIPSSVLRSGAILALTTKGNVTDLSKFTAEIGFSTDAAGQDIVATGAGIATPARLLVRVGKAAKLRVSGWQALVAGLPKGSYFLTVTLSDATGHVVSVVSQKPVAG